MKDCIFEQEIASADDYVCIIAFIGDFNAQTGELVDFTSAEYFLSDRFHFDQQIIEFINHKSLLEIYKINLNRASKAKKKTNNGFRLINICKNNNVSILNGRYGHDNDIGAVTFRETSVTDNALVSGKTFYVLSDFQITEVDRLF